MNGRRTDVDLDVELDVDLNQHPNPNLCSIILHPSMNFWKRNISLLNLGLHVMGEIIYP